MADVADDDVATNRMSVPDWLPPVDSAEALPTTGVEEGTFCYVQADGDEAPWQFSHGRWVRIRRSR